MISAMISARPAWEYSWDKMTVGSSTGSGVVGVVGVGVGVGGGVGVGVGSGVVGVGGGSGTAGGGGGRGSHGGRQGPNKSHLHGLPAHAGNSATIKMTKTTKSNLFIFLPPLGCQCA